jgi:hypothetical protein
MSKSAKIRRGGQPEVEAILEKLAAAIHKAHMTGDFGDAFSLSRNLINARAIEIIKKYNVPNMGNIAVSHLENSEDLNKSECGKFLRIAGGTEVVFGQIENIDQNGVRFPAFYYGFFSALSLFASIVEDSNVLAHSAAIAKQETAQKSGGRATGRKYKAERDARLASLMPFVLSGAGKTTHNSWRSPAGARRGRLVSFDDAGLAGWRRCQRQRVWPRSQQKPISDASIQFDTARRLAVYGGGAGSAHRRRGRHAAEGTKQ